MQHDGGAGCEIVAGSVHLLAGLVQREPEADEARTDGQAEFQQEAEEEVVLGLLRNGSQIFPCCHGHDGAVGRLAQE